jgi:conjugative transfer relaxase protein TraI
MLSVQPLKSAKGAAEYYTAAYNYYAGDAQAMRWLGKGAEHLGLTGAVEKNQMLQLLQGELPDGQKLQNKQGKHRPGFDMTFSAPKSVSILVGLGVDDELELLHDKAVELAIQQIEEEFAETRIVKDGIVHFEKTNKLVIAAFRQPSSRANEPALHTHGVTMNMTFDKDNKARSLASDIHGNRGVIEQLQRNVTYAGLLYRTHFANLLKEKGYPLTTAGDGLFEIEGMPESVLIEFSTRREEILQYMKEQGWSGAKAASAAAIITRDNKEEHDINKLREDWRQRANELGFDGHQFVKDALSLQIKPGILEQVKNTVFGLFYQEKNSEFYIAREAVDVAIETISQKSSVFELRQLKEHALKHTLVGNEIITHDLIDTAIKSKIQNQSLYQGRDPYTQQPVLTTPWLLTLETESLARIENNKGMVSPITSKKVVLDFQNDFEANTKYPLTSSQKQAMIQFLTTTDRYMAIQGYAGTGKTTMLKLTREIAESAGYQVRGLAVNSSAANELKSKGGIHADVFPVVHGELLRAKKDEFNNTIFIVDESSMLSSPQGHELIKLIEQNSSRLYLVGDDSQLPTVKNGRTFGLSQEYGIHTVEMTDNIRQKNSQLKEAVHHAIDNEVYDAVEHINDVRELNTHNERIAEMANSYLKLSQHVRENTLLFAPTHANRREITALIREGLKEEGTLAENSMYFPVLKAKSLEEVQLHYAQYYSKGDVIRFNHHSKRYGIASGDYLVVDKISQENRKNNSLRLINTNGKSFNFRLNELPAYKSTRAGFNRHIEVYQQEELELASGDRIIWTRNFKNEGIFNSERALISSINEENIDLILDSGEMKSISREHAALKHLDHGYVFTNMKVQGKDKMYGIGLIESYNKFSATIKNFLVQISRGIYSMKLVTDDKTNLVRALEENEDTKKSAIDYVSTSKLVEHQNHFSESKHRINIGSIIEKKSIKENEFHELSDSVTQYHNAREAGNQAQSAKLAHTIVADEKMFRLAKSTLGYGYPVYREDAHRYATLKLIQSLSIEEKQHFNTVKAYFMAINKTKDAWNHAIKISPTPLNKTHAFNESIKRNALAFKIASDIERYKPYLKHFSIGELNRLGIPQHHYYKQEEKAFLHIQRLTKHAGDYQVMETVRQFYSAPSEKKPLLAFEIKNHSKIAHPHLVQLAKEKHVASDVLWKEINFKAKEYADLQFKLKLPETHQKSFEHIQTYRTYGFELGKLWKEQLKQLENNQEPSKEVEEKISNFVKTRNEIASFAIQDKTYLSALQYFKIDMDKLRAHAEKNQQRNNVLDFLHSNSNFKKKLAAAERIATDVKGHYPFIKKLNIDTKQVNKYCGFITRSQSFSELSPAELDDYKKVLNYKYESKRAASSWKKIFSLKEQNIKAPAHLLARALETTAKRDYLASQLINNPQYEGIVAKEKISQDKLNSQSANHQGRLAEVNKVLDGRNQLINRIEKSNGIMKSKEVKQWHQAWDALNKQAAKIEYSDKLYRLALKGCSINSMQFAPSQKELLAKYELSFNSERASKVMKTNSNSFQNIDITVTNERLMANPERTYSAIFGEPKKITSKELRYPGGLIVSLKGSKSGLWFDFGSDKGGSPIQAIMRERGVHFKEALSIATELAGTQNLTAFGFKNKTTNRHAINEIKELKNKILSAKSIMRGTIPITKTLAEKYLTQHRKIENPSQLNVIFWPKNTAWFGLDKNGNLIEKINKIPALICPIHNEKGELTGVQRIYLDEKSANKNTLLEDAKLSQGQIRSSACILQKGEKLGAVYIAEGPETGASIAMADPKATVLVSFGLGNMSNISKIIKNQFPSHVIIAGDNDQQPKSKTFKLTLKAQELLGNQGIKSTVIFPKQIDGFEKTDWNDVLKHQGINEIKAQLGIQIPTKKEEIHVWHKAESNTIMQQNIMEKSQINTSTHLQNTYENIMRDRDIILSKFARDKQNEIAAQVNRTPIKNIEKSLEQNPLKRNEISLEL